MRNPKIIKEEVMSSFTKRFKGEVHVKINLKGVLFPSLTSRENVILIGTFTKEVKEAT